MLNYPLPLWDFSGIMKQVIKMEHNKVKNPKMVGGEPVGFLTACSMVADLNSGLP